MSDPTPIIKAQPALDPNTTTTTTLSNPKENPITSTLLGDSAATSVDHPDLVEKNRKELPKAEEVPNQVLDSKHLIDDETPAVAKNDDDKAEVSTEWVEV